MYDSWLRTEYEGSLLFINTLESPSGVRANGKSKESFKLLKEALYENTLFCESLSQSIEKCVDVLEAKEEYEKHNSVC